MSQIINYMAIYEEIDFVNEYTCSITKGCIRQTFHQTIVGNWEWKVDNEQI